VVGTLTALAAVIIADVLGSIDALGVYYVTGLFSIVAMGPVPIVVSALRKKKKLLES
jgi:hypothetical protein